MRLTKRQLKRIIREEYSRLKRRGLISEAAVDYPTGTEFGGEVTLEIDYMDMPMFDEAEFKQLCREEELGGCTVKSVSNSGDILHITGTFDALWYAWVNCCGDEPDEFMARVVSGHENCPAL